MRQEAQEMVLWLRTLPALPEDPGLMTTAGNSNFKGNGALSTW